MFVSKRYIIFYKFCKNNFDILCTDGSTEAERLAVDLTIEVLMDIKNGFSRLTYNPDFVSDMLYITFVMYLQVLLDIYKAFLISSNCWDNNFYVIPVCIGFLNVHNNVKLEISEGSTVLNVQITSS